MLHFSTLNIILTKRIWCKSVMFGENKHSSLQNNIILDKELVLKLVLHFLLL